LLSFGAAQAGCKELIKKPIENIMAEADKVNLYQFSFKNSLVFIPFFMLNKTIFFKKKYIDYIFNKEQMKLNLNAVFNAINQLPKNVNGNEG
jgi:hypothetical protein